ncbi:DUF2946 family protein [Pseudomonas sp. NPDC089554]|uniref:DUF2946 family protein n=1 Tax=Pseudomonas sp. NPDC089554 TaxID=3390653 RepID=UPI003D0326C9
MKLARQTRSQVAWVLYFSILLSSLLCAVGHGQMAGLQLSGLGDAAWCATDSSGAASSSHHGGSHDSGDMAMPSGADCMITSLFSATLLAALFGLLALLAGETTRPLPRQPAPPLPKQRWPLVNPRASPALLPAL